MVLRSAVGVKLYAATVGWMRSKRPYKKFMPTWWHFEVFGLGRGVEADQIRFLSGTAWW